MLKRKIILLFWTHGNEYDKLIPCLNFIPKYLHWEYDVLCVNKKAVQENVRFLEKDMNRTAPWVQWSNIYELARWYEVQNAIQKYDFVIDIHCTLSHCWVCIIFPIFTQDHKNILPSMPWENAVLWQPENPNNWPITQFCTCWFELEVWPANRENIEILWKSLWIFIDNITNNKQQVFPHNIYKKIGILSRSNIIPEEDFSCLQHDGESVYSFLGKNRYKEDIGCYILKRI